MAYSFAGPATGVDNLTIADNATLSITGALTYACWFKSPGNSGSQTQGIISKYDNSFNDRSVEVGLNTANKLIFIISADGGGTNLTLAVGATTVDTNWHHGCGVFNPSTQHELFLDGVSDVTGTPQASAFDNAALFSVGSIANISNGDFFFAGLIAEIGVWNTNLTTPEVALLARGYSPLLVRPSKLVLYMPLVRNKTVPKGGFAVTTAGAPTVANHPRIIMPQSNKRNRMTAPLLPPPLRAQIWM